MKKILLLAFSLSGLLLGGCVKDSVKATSNTDEVLIRVENATTENFSNFILNGTDFGGVSSGVTSEYRRFKDVWPYPFANDIAINNHYIYILDIIRLPFLANGKYRMKVVSDPTFRYTAEFIKE